VGEIAASEGHVFISYVREDSERIGELDRALTAAGLKVWRKKDALVFLPCPGGRITSLCVIRLAGDAVGVAAGGGSWTPHGDDRGITIWYGKPQGQTLADTEDDAALAAFDAAIDAAASGHLDRARDLYKQASAKGHVAALNGLGLIAEGNGDLDEAERLYSEAAASHQSPPLLNLGDLLMRRGRRREAVGWYLKFAAACGCPDPDQVVAYLVDESVPTPVPVKFLPDDERQLAPRLNLEHLDFAIAVTLISELREWRAAHQPPG